VDASFTDIYYTGISFLLAWNIFQPVFISLAALSRKGTIISAFAFFMVGLIVSAIAKNSWTLIFGRTIQGVGGGGVMAMTYVLMADLFTLEERSKFVSLLTLVYLIGTSAGPLLGGGLASHASWVCSSR
jgi:MFS family permease